MDRLDAFLADTLLKQGPGRLVEELAFLPGSFVITLDGRIVVCNEEFSKLTGYSCDELCGKLASDVVDPDERKGLEQRIKNNVPGQYHLVLRTKSGQPKYVLVSPRNFKVKGKFYRIAEFIDNTSYFTLYQEHIANLRNISHAFSIAIEQRDPYTTGHMSRVAVFAGKLAKLMVLKESEIENVVVGASIHDIGKIAIPIEILTKPTRLKDFEWQFIKAHPRTGHDIIKTINLDDAVKDIVLHHHERYDGSGYPDGLAGDDIAIGICIASLADALDAISGIRPYRRAYSLNEAITVIENEKHRYHPEAFLALRSLVQSGELAAWEPRLSQG